MKNKHYITLCPNCKEYLPSKYKRKTDKQILIPAYKYCVYCGISLENKKLLKGEEYKDKR